MISSASSQKILLEKYVEAVMNAPQSLGLTAAQDAREFWERHILDALKLIELLPKEFHEQNLKVLDVGSGNGIPGIPVAIALPKWQVVLLDSNNKKSGFLDMFRTFNSLNNVRVIAGRAEDFAHEAECRAQFDLVFARALSKLPTALELSAPFLKIGGLLVIPHGSTYQKELAQSENAMHELRIDLIESKPYQVSNDIAFTALLFKKSNDTPSRYPRKVGLPKKDPL